MIQELYREQGIRQEELGHHEQTVSDSSLSFKFKVSLLVMSCLWHVDMKEVDEEIVGIIIELPVSWYELPVSMNYRLVSKNYRLVSMNYWLV